MKETKVIRKIWVGSSVIGDSMSWHIGQEVRLGRDPKDKGVIDHIIEDVEKKGTYHIHVKKGNSILPWKTTSMLTTLEYDLVY